MGKSAGVAVIITAVIVIVVHVAINGPPGSLTVMFIYALVLLSKIPWWVLLFFVRLGCLEIDCRKR